MGNVWVAYADDVKQYYIQLEFVEGMTLLDAIHASGILERAGIVWPLDVGIFGERVLNDQQVLVVGDRVEIYRPLTINPKDIRRNRATLNSLQTRASKASNRFKR